MFKKGYGHFRKDIEFLKINDLFQEGGWRREKI